MTPQKIVWTQRWHGMLGATLMITTDREKIWLDTLNREQDWAISSTLREVQERHMEEIQAMAGTTTHGKSDGHSTHKCHSASPEEDVKQSREESLEAGTIPHERRCSLHHKSKSNLQFPASPGKQHPCSTSFTAVECSCSRSETPGRLYSQARSGTLCRWHSQFMSGMPCRWHPHSRSSMPNPSRCRDSTLHTSRKCPVNHPPNPMEATPTQSPVQRTPKLKLIIQQAPATKCSWNPL